MSWYCPSSFYKLTITIYSLSIVFLFIIIYSSLEFRMSTSKFSILDRALNTVKTNIDHFFAKIMI